MGRGVVYGDGAGDAMKAVGEAAPGFRAVGASGEVELATQLENGPVVLYFFPKANTSG